MRTWRVSLVAVVGMILSVGGSARAETGMGLMIDKDSGALYRADIENGTLVYTTGAIGSNAVSARFSPNGDKIVFVNEASKVIVSDLTGDEQLRFTAFQAGSVSWTQSGIWVGGLNKAVLYDASTGDQQRTMVPAGNWTELKVGTISHNERTAAGRDSDEGTAVSIKMDQGNEVVVLDSGCSAGPSPDGSLLTGNLWEEDIEHQTMRIHNRNGAEVHYFYLFDIIPYPASETDGWSWNAQKWSSNSQDVILIPTGRGFPQMWDSEMPWIYNLATQEAFCLYDDPYETGVFLRIHDFYAGKVGPRPEPPAVDAGPDLIATVNTATTLDATITEQGLPSGQLSPTWEQVSGPEDATFDDVHVEDPTVTFPDLGEYVLRLNVTSGNFSESDEVRVDVVDEFTEIIQIQSPQPGDVWSAGETQNIEWTTLNLDDVVLYYSTDDGESWDVISDSIDDSAAEWGSYPWKVPNEPSKNCHIRMQGYFGSTTEQVGPFEITSSSSSTSSISAPRLLDDNELALEPEPVAEGCACRSESGPRGSGLGGAALLLLTVPWLRRRRGKPASP